MLNSVSVGAKTANNSRPQFAPEVWDRIAVEMIKSVPNWQGHSFDMVEFEEAMEAVLPQMEQRTFTDFDDVSPHLFPAFERIGKSQPKAAQKPVEPTKAQKRIVAAPKRWTPEQWEQVTLELHRLAPTAFAERLVKVGNKMAETAQKVLPAHLHRHFVQVVDFRAHCLKIWDALPADVRNPELQERKIVDFPSGPVMAPIAKKSDSQNAMASAIQEAFNAPTTDVKERKKPVRWTAKDWLDLAREMHKQNPHANYFSSQFPKMDLAAMRDAQREVFPIHRRMGLVNSAGLREPLIEAFKNLRFEMMREVDAQIAAEAEEIAAEKAGEIAPVVIAKEPQIVAESIAEVATTPAPVVATMVATPSVSANLEQVNFMGGLLNAVAPLAQFLVSQAASQMAPAIIAAIMPELKKQMGTMVQDAMKQAQDAVSVRIIEREVVTHKLAVPSAVAPAAVSAVQAIPVFKSNNELALPTEKAKKPLIAILGPQGAQKAAIERDFPDYRFTFIEHGHGIKEAAAKAELFICAVANAPASLKDQIKKHLNADIVRYLQNGGVSSIKRQINVWKAGKVFA